jgi:Ca2+/H+ antiporter
MEENVKKAFDFAADATKQLITLSTAIIALTITFSKDIVGAANIGNSFSIFAAWILFILSIVFGILTLLALTGTLQPMNKKKNSEEESDTESEEQETTAEPISINESNIRLLSGLQIGTFILALIFTVSFGFSSINSSKEDTKNKDCIEKDCIEIIKRSEYKLVKPISIDTLKVHK